MIVYLLIFKIVCSQELTIWLRVTQVSKPPINDDIYEELCHLDEFTICIEYEHMFQILIFQGYIILYEIQIDEKLGKWIEIKIYQQGLIQIDEKKFTMNSSTFAYIKIFELKKNFYNFFLEISKDHQYNNFLLQDYKQTFTKDLNFNAFISDYDAMINLWFKIMVDYDTVHGLQIQYYKEYKFNTIDILYIQENMLIVFNNTINYQALTINGQYWNNIIIYFDLDNINLQIDNQIIKGNYLHQNLRNVVNKEIILEQEGLYIGHLSIYYHHRENFCSPGCIRCSYNKCLECKTNQYLFDNQCSCQKFYQSQDINGDCRMIPDLYVKNLQELDEDFFVISKCQFGFIYFRGTCYRCPWFQDRVCSDCLFMRQLDDNQDLFCNEQGISARYVFKQDQFISYYDKKQEINFKRKEIVSQNYQLKNYTQLFKKVNQNKKGLLIHKGFKRCTYNCVCQQEFKAKTYYCLSLLESQNFSQNIQGIPIFNNNKMNVFTLEVQVFNNKHNLIYANNQRYYNQLQTIITNIDIDSIILTGVHFIHLIFEFQNEYYFDQAFIDIELCVIHLRQHLDIFKRTYYISIDIPYIHLEISSNQKFQFNFDNSSRIGSVHKLTLRDIQIQASFNYLFINAATVIMKNIYFNSTQIGIEIVCDKLLIKNLIFQDIFQKKIVLFTIHSKNAQLFNISISNCTLVYVSIFSFLTINQNLQLTVDSILIQNSLLNQTQIFEIEQQSCLMSILNFILRDTKLYISYLIFNQNHITQLRSIQNLFIINSFIYRSFFPWFFVELIETINIYNSTLENIGCLFKVIQQDYQQFNSLRISNIILRQIDLIDVINLFHIKSNGDVDINWIIFEDVRNIGQQDSIFYIQAISIQLLFIQLRSLQTQSFIDIISEQVFNYIISISDSQIQRALQIQSGYTLHMSKIRFTNISLFYKLLSLKPKFRTNLKNLIFSNFNLNQFEKINKFIYLQTDFGGLTLMEKLLFINININNSNYNSIYIELISPIKIIKLFNVYIINNWIKSQSANIITVQSKIFSIDLSQFTKLTIINDYQTQVNALDLNGSVVEISQINFKSIKLINCNLISQKGVQFYLIFINLYKITLQNSKLIYINTLYIFSTSILKLNASLIKSNDILININSENIDGDLDFYYSRIQEAELQSHIISINSDIYLIRLYNLKFTQINSTNAIYLIYQKNGLGNIKGLLIFVLTVEKSQFGLFDLQRCSQIDISNIKISEIKFSHQLISVYNNFIFQMASIMFKLINVSSSLIIISQSDEFTNKITILHLLVHKLVQFNYNEALIRLNKGNKYSFTGIKFINNSCTTSLIHIQDNLNVSRIQFLDSFFTYNNVTQLFTFKNYTYLQQSDSNQLMNYFYVNTRFDLSKYIQQQQFKIFSLKLNINDFNKLEQLIHIQSKINNLTTNQNIPQFDYFYLPSGQILNSYKILQLHQLSFKQYIHKFQFSSDIDEQTMCNLSLIQIQGNQQDIFQNYSVPINQDLSNILSFKMDPYKNQQNYQIQVNCQLQSTQYEILFKVKPFPCSMGEYYFNGQCNLCSIQCQQNTLKKNQNKCDYFDQSTVTQMKKGLLKLLPGNWRPDYHNKYINQCLQQNCQGGWNVGDQSCNQGHLGALCSECDIYNTRGDGSYSKLQGLCISCSSGNFRLITYIIIILIYQLFQTCLAARRSYQYISSKKKLIQQNRFYLILKSLQVDQISICLKILQDMYIKLILINKLQFEIPDVINIGFNIFPQQLVNQGLYCNIYYLGPNILILELIYILLFTMILIQISNFIYIILVYKKLIQQSITYITSIFQYGYKQSYFYITYLYLYIFYDRLLSQIIYVQISNEYYLIGNQQYQYRGYKYITLKVIIPIFVVYSILIPLIIIYKIVNKKKSNLQQFSKFWAYYIQDYNSKCQFWELYQLIKYSALLFIYFYYYLERNNQLMFFIIGILIDLIISKNINIYNIKNLNQIQYESQLKLIALLILFNYYYQVQYSQILIYVFYGFILLLNYYILSPIFSNIFRIIIAKYIHYTIKYQNKIVVKQQIFYNRYPIFIKLQRKYSLSQNPARAKENFQKLIKLFKNNKFNQNKTEKPMVIHHAPYNTSYLELQTSKEVEMITL